MSGEIVAKAYSAASEKVAQAHREAVTRAKVEVDKAKFNALKKLGS
jgi:hypothetical protein